MEAWLDTLVDAEKVLECCEPWPHERVQALRFVTRLQQRICALSATISAAVATGGREGGGESVAEIVRRLGNCFAQVKLSVETMERTKVEDAAHAPRTHTHARLHACAHARA